MVLLEAIGTVAEARNRNYRVAINRQTHEMRRPQHNDLADIEEVVALRRSWSAPASRPPARIITQGHLSPRRPAERRAYCRAGKIVDWASR